MSFLRLPTINGQFKRAGKKRQYTPNQLTLAYEEVVKEGASVHKAAKLYGVPESTLRDRFRGPMQPAPEGDVFNIQPGPSPTLSLEEESDLEKHCAYMASIGYGYSRNEFLNIATEYAISLHKKQASDPPFAQSWYDGFRKRHPDITLSKPQKLSVARAKCTSDEVLDKYFTSLEHVMETNNLLDKPENIWNMDETGLLMEHSPTNVMCAKGSTPQAITSNRGKTITILAAGNAVGTRLPPYYIFPGKRWNEELLQGACPGSRGTMTESGWSNSEVFQDYLEKHFLRHVPTSGPPVLIMFDGHKSHINLTLKEWGDAHNIVFFVLPPHTSHVTQPLDVGCFGPLKRVYYRECQAFMRKTPGVHINRYNVAALSSLAYNKGVTPDNLISSFRKTGIYPLERGKISSVKTAPSKIYVNDHLDQPDDETSNEETTTTEEISFLESRRITKVVENKKKRNYVPTLQGNMMSPSNKSLLKRPLQKTKQTENIPPKQKSSTNKKVKTNVGKTSKPVATSTSMSGYDSETSCEEVDSLDESMLCCVCKKLYPENTNAYVVDIITWAQCDKCEKWVHLKYCTSVRVVRRGSTFVCPICC